MVARRRVRRSRSPLGGAVTCTIVNNDNGPKLKLVKQIVNDNGGTEDSCRLGTLAADGDRFA